MTTWDAVADLPLVVEDYALQRPQLDVSSEFRAPEHGDPPARRRRGGHGRGRHLRRPRPGGAAGGGAGPAARRPLDARVVLRPRRGARPVAGAARPRALAPVPGVGLRVRGARPRAAPGEPRAARGARTRAAARALRRLAAAGRAADARAGDAAARALPGHCASSSTPRSDWTPEIFDALRATGAVDSIDLKGLYEGSIVDQGADPGLYARVADAFPDGLDRGPQAHPGDRRGPAPAPRPHHVGRQHPRGRRHRGAPLPAADGQRQALARRAAARSSSRPTTTARSAASACTAAGSSSSASAAGRSSCLAGLFHPDAPNDVAPGGFNAPDPPPGLPESPLDPAPEPTGFRRRA